MKSSDISDFHVVALAREWRRGGECVVDALIAEGVPEKLAYAKVEKLCGHRKDLLEYGTSPRCAWPTEKGIALLASVMAQAIGVGRKAS